MHSATAAREFLSRLHPWVGKAVHVHWTRRRSHYQSELNALLLALLATRGRIPPALGLRIEGFLGRLYKEWFPRTWRSEPTYAEVLADFRWWLGVAERWTEPPARPARKPRPAREPLAKQPPRLLRLLSLPTPCTQRQFMTSWRRFLKSNHPDLNPDQTPEERRRFAEAVSLWRR